MTLQEYLTDMGPGSQARLAETTGLRVATISDLATGKRRPSVESARKIEWATGGAVTAVELLGLDRPLPDDEPPHAA